MNRKICVMLSLALSICCTFTPALAVGDMTYTLQSGKNYRIINRNANSSYTIPLNAEDSASYDYAQYNESGWVENYGQNSNSRINVLAGGETIVSVRSGNIVATFDSDNLSFEEITEPALVTFTLEAGKNYMLSNIDANNKYTISNNSKTAGTYDIVQYNQDESIATLNNGNYELSFHSYSADFGVSPGGYSIISIGESTLFGFIPYTWKDTINFTEVGNPALLKLKLSAGKTYVFTNKDTANAQKIKNDSNGAKKYSYTSYDIDGKQIYAQNDIVTSNPFHISAGGHNDISIGSDDITIWIPFTQYQNTISVADTAGTVLPKPSYSAINNPVQYQSGLAPADEYFYNEIDEGENVSLPTEQLDGVTNAETAVSAVDRLSEEMTLNQKTSATGTDLATLYAETAVAKAASKKVSGSEIIINKVAVSDLEAVAAQTSAAVETALVNGGITTARLVSNTVTLTTDETGEITIKIDPDILTTQIDKIRVETPTYALTLKVSDLEPDLTEILTITAQDVGSGYAPGNQNTKTTVQVNLPQGKITNPVTVSLPKDTGDTTYQAVIKTDGTATSSKYNPATTTMDGKINASGSYTVQTNQKNFTDISNKSAEMQKAIEYLASKGIINGTSDTSFSPDGSISRAEIAALLVRALGKLDNSATNSFTDVKSSDWYYTAAGSSQRTGLINGYDDNTFRGTTQITKEQIIAVAARVLTSEMGYKAPSNTASYLGKYSDEVVSWARPEVALATKENLVVYRVDGTFKGDGNMTRGDASIIIYRLFQKIW